MASSSLEQNPKKEKTSSLEPIAQLNLDKDDPVEYQNFIDNILKFFPKCRHSGKPRTFFLAELFNNEYFFMVRLIHKEARLDILIQRLDLYLVGYKYETEENDEKWILLKGTFIGDVEECVVRDLCFRSAELEEKSGKEGAVRYKIFNDMVEADLEKLKSERAMTSKEHIGSSNDVVPKEESDNQPRHVEDAERVVREDIIIKQEKEEPGKLESTTKGKGSKASIKRTGLGTGYGDLFSEFIKGYTGDAEDKVEKGVIQMHEIIKKKMEDKEEEVKTKEKKFNSLSDHIKDLKTMLTGLENLEENMRGKTALKEVNEPLDEELKKVEEVEEVKKALVENVKKAMKKEVEKDLMEEVRKSLVEEVNKTLVKKALVEEVEKALVKDYVEEVKKALVEEVKKAMMEEEVNKTLVEEVKKALVEEVKKDLVEEAKKDYVKEVEKILEEKVKKDLVEEVKRALQQEVNKDFVKEVKKALIMEEAKKVLVEEAKKVLMKKVEKGLKEKVKKALEEELKEVVKKALEEDLMEEVKKDIVEKFKKDHLKVELHQQVEHVKVAKTAVSNAIKIRKAKEEIGKLKLNREAMGSAVSYLKDKSLSKDGEFEKKESAEHITILIQMICEAVRIGTISKHIQKNYSSKDEGPKSLDGDMIGLQFNWSPGSRITAKVEPCKDFFYQGKELTDRSQVTAKFSCLRGIAPPNRDKSKSKKTEEEDSDKKKPVEDIPEEEMEEVEYEE